MSKENKEIEWREDSTGWYFWHNGNIYVTLGKNNIIKYNASKRVGKEQRASLREFDFCLSIDIIEDYSPYMSSSKPIERGMPVEVLDRFPLFRARFKQGKLVYGLRFIIPGLLQEFTEIDGLKKSLEDCLKGGYSILLDLLSHPTLPQKCRDGMAELFK